MVIKYNISPVVFVFYCCCNRFLQTWRLKIRNFILCQFWKPEVQNQFHWVEVNLSAGLVPSRGFRRESLSFPATGGLLHSFWHHSNHRHITFCLFCSQTSLCLPLIKTLVIISWTHLDNSE